MTETLPQPGDGVRFHFRGSQEPFPGQVLASHPTTKSIDIVYYSHSGVRTARGVRRDDDPWFKNYPESRFESGFFSVPRNELLEQLQRRLQTAEGEIAMLKEQLVVLSKKKAA